MVARRLSFVTVVYEVEYPLAVLQARSMSRYIQRDSIGEIILIDNSVRPMPSSWTTQILNEYGPLRSHVRIIRGVEVCKIPITSGWHSQQILKLTVALLVQTEFYVVLDAKNHFVWPADEEFFVTSDGRPCVNAYSYEKHPLRASLEHVMDNLGLNSVDHVGFFTATITPYTFKTQWVRELVLEIGDGSSSRFAQRFVARELTEFFLYAGWLVRDGRDLSKIFLFHQRFAGVIWPDHCSEIDTRNTLAVANEAKVPIFSVHRNALKEMTIDSCELLASFWVSRRLFQSKGEAQAFIEMFRSNLSRQSKMLSYLALPYEIKKLSRRIARRITLNK